MIPYELTFRKELEMLVNKYSLENKSNTPDFILACYLEASLNCFDLATTARDNWKDNFKPLN